MTLATIPPRTVRLLHLEDSARDVQYIEDLLAEEGLVCQITQVARRAPFEAALRAQAFDVVICDYSLPDLDGLSALRLVRAISVDTPVIIVSGSIDSLSAVQCLREGATDLLLKNRLERLPSAVNRALDERERRTRLREVEERFQQLADQSPTGFWFVAADASRVEYVSDAVETLWGERAAVLTREAGAFLACVHDDDRPRVTAAWDSWVRGDAPSFDEELRVRTSDDTSRWLHHSGTRLADAAGRVTRLCCITQDITERKAMEARMQHTQRLEAVGRLAGGIAHDFNTLLTVITATSELALARMDPEDPLLADLSEIRSAGERGAGLVAQLIAFSRQQIMRPRVIDPVELMRNLERMLQRLIGAHIRFELHLPTDRVFIRVDPGQLEQVLVNLVVNARDAMRGGGVLAVSLDVIQPDADLVDKFGGPGASCVQITVRDSGVGMPVEVQRRVFEPFFTTKVTEGGTGLGLSTVHGIVEQSGGVVRLQSAIGMGTTFRILLPQVADESRRPTPTQTRAIPAARSGAATVLVVDDDQALRYLVKRTLSSVGYTVLMAENGPTALRLLEDLRGEVDLLLTDIVMPEMSGHQLAERGRVLNPDLRVLYMSGYTEDEVSRRSLHDHMEAFVPKPFTVTSLTRGVSRALGRED
ncbi:MAG: response regulator [Gemmatimonadota bacterium]|nr:response regulator [Gemmatimonadota bacterium]MDQ8167917.1 response regulator [Gemmatimonadota bacterium]MDQ8172775.1 response regulator [Gemmatimonadota bacterium]